ncbi:NRDE family protein [Halopiger goleimassiliensis]|uniref:NRDE family protein n=1 Tax=Halopiger goleimassiliensis TaxID=1293048 RepID=UPI0006782A70|nr:NRDE family protein [Halopiger goleimassiliensis]
MCTLTLAWQAFEEAPVAVAANRDEALERESLPPSVYSEEPLVVAPQDAEAGGTWIGCNEFGVVAGITNKWTDRDLAGERSRGRLVADVLEARSAAEAATLVERETTTTEYEGFYLTVADSRDAYCYAWDGDLERIDFDPGVHVIVNAAVDDHRDVPSHRRDAARTQAENAGRVREDLAVGDEESVDEWLERAGDVLGDHEYGVCIHGDGFGTRSSSLLALGETATYRYADGPPCRTTYEPVALPDRLAADCESHI